MNKTSKIFESMLIWILVTALIIVAGSIVFAIKGFAKDVDTDDAYVLVVDHDGFAVLTDAKKEATEKVIKDEIANLNIEYVYSYTTDDGAGVGTFEFVFDKDTETTKLDAAVSAIKTALEAEDASNNLIYGYCTTTYHFNAAESFTKHLWRAVLAVGITLVIAFLYTLIRYKLAAAVAVLTGGFASGGLLFAIASIARIGVGAESSAILAFAVALGVLISMLIVGQSRKEGLNGEFADCSASGLVANTIKSNLVWMLVVLGIAVVGTVAFTAIVPCYASFALLSLAGVIAAAFSGILLAPSVYVKIKNAAANKADTKKLYKKEA